MQMRLILRLLSQYSKLLPERHKVNSSSLRNLTYREAKYSIHIRKFAISFLFSIVFAALMAISANSFMYLPFTPVPITMQVFTVLIAAILLGSRWALASQIVYISLGVAGLPVFAGFKNGFAALTGSTAGYIIGFALASFIAGYIFENNVKRKPGHSNILLVGFLSSLGGLSVIYFLGFIHLFGFLNAAGGSIGPAGLLVQSFKLGVLPFITFDLLKILMIINILNLDDPKK